MRKHQSYRLLPSGETILDKEIPWPYTLDEFLAELGEIRWKHETGGVVVNLGDGYVIRFPTTRDARASLMMELDAAEKIGASYVTAIPFGPLVATVTLDGLRQLVDAINLHVRDCFAMQAAYTVKANKGVSLDDLAEQMQRGWPGQTEE